VSRDRRTTFLVVALRTTTGDSAAGLVPVMRETVRTALDALPGGRHYVAHVTGRAPLDLDIRTVSAQDSRHVERLLIAPTLLILILAFGAMVAAVLPLIVGFLAIVVSLTIIGVMAHFTPMSVFVLNMTTMIGLGVGIDYSLLVVTRFREELGRGRRRREAAVTTLLTAGAAVVTSGLTVVVGFGALFFTPLVETRSVGLGGLVTVAVAVLLSTTLLPALLAIMGRTIERPAVAGPPSCVVARSPNLGDLGPHAEPAPVESRHIGRSRNRAPDGADLLDPNRVARPTLVAQ
jgi:RND superfamily putative drug exporter